jgi:hypothetical protein
MNVLNSKHFYISFLQIASTRHLFHKSLKVKKRGPSRFFQTLDFYKVNKQLKIHKYEDTGSVNRL